MQVCNRGKVGNAGITVVRWVTQVYNRGKLGNASN